MGSSIMMAVLLSLLLLIKRIRGKSLAEEDNRVCGYRILRALHSELQLNVISNFI